MNRNPHNVCPCSWCGKPKGTDGELYYFMPEQPEKVSICASCINDAVSKCAAKAQEKPRLAA